jgi:protein-tyrosine phosphatase
MSQWWIDENRVMGSSNPFTEELEHLFQIGFNTVISLLDENEQFPYYDVEKIVALGFDRSSIPIKDYTAPALKQFMKFLEIVHRDAGKVLIHCQGGYGRTGTMAAAYWMDKGLSAQEAIRKVRRLRPGAFEIAEQELSVYNLEGYFLTLNLNS